LRAKRFGVEFAPMDKADEEALYRAVGERIRQAREGRPERLSQAALAERLSVSRASVVNIEAGRQHAPLSLLWKVAQQLDIELASLIPSRSELMAPPANVELAEDMREQLKVITKGDQVLEGALSSFIAQAVTQLSSGNAKQPSRTKRTKRS
jgi:transcriptional regulator with XRE-family HTH domain